VRVSIAVVSIALGFHSVTGSLAQVLKKADPARAHILAPNDGVITAALAEQQFAMTSASDTDSEPAHLARLALRQDATAADALNVLGLQAQLRNETERTREFFRYSLLLSRRELRPQFWAIEEAVNRGDIRSALRAYDIALRTSSDAASLLFPVLSSALAEPRVRVALLPIIQTGPGWTANFVDYVATNAADPVAVATFFQQATVVGLPVDDNDRAKLVNALSVKAGYEEAWDYYTSFRPNVHRSNSRDAEFTFQSATRTLFDWRTSEDARLSAVILGTGGDGMLDFAVPPTIGGTLLSQAQLLPPGTYHLKGKSGRIDQPSRSQPYWTLRCRDGRELGRVPIPNSDKHNGLFQGKITVPQNCPEQTLSLIARATDSITGVLGQIDRAALVPAELEKASVK